MESFQLSRGGPRRRCFFLIRREIPRESILRRLDSFPALVAEHGVIKIFRAAATAF
jgi:hypothetical protein